MVYKGGSIGVNSYLSNSIQSIVRLSYKLSYYYYYLLLMSYDQLQITDGI